MERKEKDLLPHMGAFLIDLTIVFGLVIVSVLEVTNIINIELVKQPEIFEIFLLLLPNIITMVSIILSIGKEKVYGVSRSEFNKLRGFWFYSFFHMVICMIFIFIIYQIFVFNSLTLSIYILYGVSVFYTLYFSIQEIPVLMNNNQRLKKIIRNKYKHRSGNFSLGSQKESNTLYTILNNILFTEGIRTLYDTLRDKYDGEYNEQLLNDLLSMQNQYFWDALVDIDFIKQNVYGNYKDINFVKAIDLGFNNIKELLLFQNLDYKTIISKEDATYQLTRCTFSLYNICEKADLINKRNKGLKDISNALLTPIGNHNNSKEKKYSFIVLMTITTLAKGDTWFLESLANGDYANYALFSSREPVLEFFLSVVIIYVKDLFPTSTEKLEMFINKSLSGLNSRGKSWKRFINHSINYLQLETAKPLLSQMLKIYKAIPSTYYSNVSLSENESTHKYKNNFREYLFSSWIEIMLYIYFPQLTSEDILSYINSTFVNDEEIEEFVHYLPEHWIEDGDLKKDAKLIFLPFFVERKYQENLSFFNKEVLKGLVDFHKNYIKEKIKQESAKPNLDLETIKNEYKQVFDTISKESFYDNSIDLDNEPLLYYAIRLKGIDNQGLVQASKDHLKEALAFKIKKEVEKKIIKERYLTETDESFTNDSLQKLSLLAADYINKYSFIKNRETIDQLFPNIKKIETDFLPIKFIGKEGCFSFNVRFDETHTEIRYLTNSEIDEIIDKEYTMINGLYRYSETKNNLAETILVTRGELFDYLSSQIIMVLLVFKQKIQFDSKKCLIIKED